MLENSHAPDENLCPPSAFDLGFLLEKHRNLILLQSLWLSLRELFLTQPLSSPLLALAWRALARRALLARPFVSMATCALARKLPLARRLAFALVWGQALAPAWGLMSVVLKRLG